VRKAQAPDVGPETARGAGSNEISIWRAPADAAANKLVEVLWDGNATKFRKSPPHKVSLAVAAMSNGMAAMERARNEDAKNVLGMAVAAMMIRMTEDAMELGKAFQEVDFWLIDHAERTANSLAPTPNPRAKL
jgi:hypothetical protein